MQTITLDGCTCQCQEVINKTGIMTTEMPWIKVIEITLVVLVVILVILGLIIGYKKLKLKGKDEDEEEEKSKYH